MKEVRKPSILPVYAVGAVFLLYSLLFPLYRLSDFLICGVLAAAAYVVLRKVLPERVVMVEEEAPKTGNAALDAVMLQGRQAMGELRQLNEKIPDAQISQNLRNLDSIMGGIFAQVQEDPKKLGAIRQMMNYYLPTTLKLLRKYEALQGQEAGLSNVQTLMQEIKDALNRIEIAFRKQLDSLYEYDVVDITADIQVMEQTLKTQGLTAERDWK